MDTDRHTCTDIINFDKLVTPLVIEESDKTIGTLTRTTVFLVISTFSTSSEQEYWMKNNLKM